VIDTSHCKVCDAELDLKWAAGVGAPGSPPRQRCPGCTDTFVSWAQDVHQSEGLSTLARECDKILRRHS